MILIAGGVRVITQGSSVVYTWKPAPDSGTDALHRSTGCFSKGRPGYQHECAAQLLPGSTESAPPSRFCVKYLCTLLTVAGLKKGLQQHIIHS